MNLSSRLDPQLWDAVRSNYERDAFKAAVQDGIIFMAGVIRERTDLDVDGVELVGRAFGGESPLLKVTRMRTQTEKNIQEGVQFLLRGIFMAIRNPRAHELHTDSQQDAEAILLFLNYLLAIIGESKAPFTPEEFIAQVLDRDFVPGPSYSDALVGELPEKKRLDMALELLGRRSEVPQIANLRHIFAAFQKVLTDEEWDEVLSSISEAARKATAFEDVASLLAVVPPDHWTKISEIGRLRLENKVFHSIRVGACDPYGSCFDGQLATWASDLFPRFANLEKVRYALYRKLASESAAERLYVVHFFFGQLVGLPDEPRPTLERSVVEALDYGDEAIYSAVSYAFLFDDRNWGEDVKEALAAFQKQSELAGEDDLPF